MTDITDIKALRDQPDHDPYALVMAQNEALTKGIVVLQSQLEAERQRVVELEEHSKKLYEGFHQERQRADDLQRLVHVEASSFANERVRADKLAAHIAALKGDQVPVGIFAGTDECSEVRHILWLSGASKLQAGDKLFTAPQKPVVLPLRPTQAMIEAAKNELRQLCEPDSSEWDEAGDEIVFLWQAMVTAIEAAGGIVKDGE